MKQILGLDDRKVLNAQRFVVHGNELADRHDIANAFNDYFTSIGSTLASSISSNTNPLSYINVAENTLYMPNVSNNDVISIIHTVANPGGGAGGTILPLVNRLSYFFGCQHLWVLHCCKCIFVAL